MHAEYAELGRLGLSEYEIKAYIALVRHGSLNGKNLSKLSTVPQSKIYEVLYRLAEKKFVSVLDVKPKVFAAIRPKIAITGFLRAKREELEALEKEIPEKIEGIKRIGEPKTDELITVYRGRKNTHPLVVHKFVTAQKYVKDMFTFEYLPASVLREIKKCIERGVKIYMLATSRSDENIKLMRKVRQLGVQVRYYPVREIRLAIKDGTESYQMIVNPRDFMDRVSVVIESLELTRALEHYFDYLWSKAKPV